jgi:hypothetical protein
VAVVEDEIEPADPEAGPEEPLLPAGVPAGDPRGGAEGEPGEEHGERGLEDDGLGLGEATDDVGRQDRGEEVEALVARRADGAHLPPGGRRRGAGAAGPVVGRGQVVPRVAGAERGVGGEHARRRAERHGRAPLAGPPKGSFGCSAQHGQIMLQLTEVKLCFNKAT